jgi:hypothetical protein
MNIDNLVDIGELLEMFSLDRSKAIDKYKELMNGPPEDYKTVYEQLEQEEIIGTDEFKKSMNQESEDKKTINLDEILQAICPTPSDYKLIKEGSRKRYLMKYKYEYTNEALNQGYTMMEISKSINMTTAAIRKMI